MRRAITGIVIVLVSSACYGTKHDPDDGHIDGERDAAVDAPVDAPDAGADAAPPDPAERAKLEAYCGGIAETTCAALEACCPEGWSEGRRAECLDRLNEPCLNTLGPDVDSGAVRIDSSGLPACRTAITAAVAGCPEELREPAFLPECVALIGGTAEPGGCCDGAQACGTGLGCGRIDDCTCEEGATCRVLPGEGEPCLAGYQCARGLVCDGNRCTVPLPAGAACNIGDDSCIGRCSDVCVAEAWDYCRGYPQFTGSY